MTTYSIKEVADKFDLTISTIRYYDKKGLLPFVAKNKSGYREFTESDLNLIHTICCLKNTGMPIHDIKEYIECSMEGSKTIEQRKQLLQSHKEAVLQQQAQLMENLKEIEWKIERYDSPDAKEKIDAQVAYVIKEKQEQQLAHGFRL
ncbi:MerR family transcriptional regulator [Enterococcus viikkiensis]|uniref:MerR family transcriptional regulator n=1 Tax=Enterococcus viikkiensis TaxID=930854 RepID=A0ABU3FRI0_9ENTE|nr:MerR family transcriptional regulator [Enterococcus viikkiensis]MDT2828576.1 MerR family transcriptional regulator [Enterococcus viikkiensis]